MRSASKPPVNFSTMMRTSVQTASSKRAASAEWTLALSGSYTRSPSSGSSPPPTVISNLVNQWNNANVICREAMASLIQRLILGLGRAARRASVPRSDCSHNFCASAACTATFSSTLSTASSTACPRATYRGSFVSFAAARCQSIAPINASTLLPCCRRNDNTSAPMLIHSPREFTDQGSIPCPKVRANRTFVLPLDRGSFIRLRRATSSTVDPQAPGGSEKPPAFLQFATMGSAYSSATARTNNVASSCQWLQVNALTDPRMRSCNCDAEAARCSWSNCSRRASPNSSPFPSQDSVTPSVKNTTRSPGASCAIPTENF